MILMIDNYDSFTYNVVQYLGELRAEVVVVRNDQVTIDDIIEMNPDSIVISPGPCTPNKAGISLQVIESFAGKKPLLGICLGHQTIGLSFGGHIIRAKQVMHGKTSPVYHTGEGIFRGLPSPFNVTRYHSLVIEQSSLPACLQVTAWTQQPDNNMDEIMGIKHKYLPIEGLQFHPESILTEHGHQLLENFLAA